MSIGQSALSSPIERRIHKRLPISGRIPAVLLDERGISHSFIGVDISNQGMGLVLNYSPELGSTLRLQLESPVTFGVGVASSELVFVVKWAVDKTEGHKLRRVGLRSEVEQHDLIEVFKRFDSVLIEES